MVDVHSTFMLRCVIKCTTFTSCVHSCNIERIQDDPAI